MQNYPKLPRVVLNASVILSGLRSPSGGSGVILNLVKRRQIHGIVSDAILDEVIRNSWKIKQTREAVKIFCGSLFPRVLSAPDDRLIKIYKKKVPDPSDAHLFATYQEIKGNYLVSLDKHHVLSLRGKIRGINIVSPKQLLQGLRGNSR